MVSIIAATRGLSLPSTNYSWTFRKTKLHPSVPVQRRERHQLISFGTQNGDFIQETNKINEPPAEDSTLTDIEARLIDATSEIFEKEETVQMMKKLGSAMDRVKIAQMALEAFRKEQLNAIDVEQVQPQNSDVAKSAEVLIAAEQSFREASSQLSDAESKLEFVRKWESDDVDEAVEKGESVKSGAIAAVTSAAVYIPYLFLSFEDPTGGSAIVSLSFMVLSAALFGVCFRYILRRDLGNAQLKFGAVAGFSAVRGLAQVEGVLPIASFGSSELQSELWAQAAGSVLETALVFAFIAVAIELAMREGYLSPFPSRRQK